MKNKSILSTWNAASGSIKREKGHKSCVRSMLVMAVMALFATNFVDARRGSAEPAPKQQQQQRQQQRRGAAPQKQVPLTRKTGALTTTAATVVPEKWGDFKSRLLSMLQATKNPADRLGIVDRIKDQLALTQEQIGELNHMVREVNFAEREGLLEQKVQQLQLLWQQQQQQGQQPQPEVPFSVSGVVGGAAEVGTQAAGQVKGYYDWMKEKMYRALTGTYVSGMGAAKYIAPAVLIAAAGPVGMLAAGLGGLAIGGTAALTTSGAGLAIWGLENIADRANFMKLSGGHGTTESWLETLRAQLTFILNNKAAYPYLLAKKEALTSRNELYSTEKGDPTGVIKQAHDAILAECQAQLSAMNPGSSELEREKEFVENVMTIRKSNGFAQLTPDQYMAALRANNDLIKAEALVSEYNRALNRKSLQEIKAKQQAEAALLALPAAEEEV